MSEFEEKLHPNSLHKLIPPATYDSLSAAYFRIQPDHIYIFEHSLNKKLVIFYIPAK
jgi:hypothetical protein